MIYLYSLALFNAKYIDEDEGYMSSFPSSHSIHIKYNLSGQICVLCNDAFYNLFSAKYEIEIQEILFMWVETL